MQKELLLRKLDILKNSYKEVRKKGNSPEAKVSTSRLSNWLRI